MYCVGPDRSINPSQNRVIYLLSFNSLSKIALPSQSKNIPLYYLLIPDLHNPLASKILVPVFHSHKRPVSNANCVPSSSGLLASSREVVPLDETRSITRSPQRQWSQIH